MTVGLLSIRLALVVAMAGAFAGPASAEPSRVTFPDNLDALEHYATVRRGNVTEHMLTTKAAIDAIKAKQAIPFGTHFVLADYRDGKIYRYFIMQSGAGWGEDYDSSRRTANWQFQWFWADKSINTAENTARCQSCHSNQAGSDYLFTGYRVPHFNGTPVE